MKTKRETSEEVAEIIYKYVSEALISYKDDYMKLCRIL